LAYVSDSCTSCYVTALQPDICTSAHLHIPQHYDRAPAGRYSVGTDVCVFFNFPLVGREEFKLVAIRK
jgi:hypothetical protein